MLHKITVSAITFAQGLKDCALYVDKNGSTGAAHYAILRITPKSRKLSMIACDGLGLYERRIDLVTSGKKSVASLPGKDNQLLIPYKDLSTLCKIIGANVAGPVSLEVDDESKANNCYSVKLTMPNGSSASFHSDAQTAPFDFTNIIQRAEKGKKNKAIQNSLCIPANELVRAAKVLPKKAFHTEVRMFTHCEQTRSLTLLEYQDDDNTEIRVIFMSRLPEEEAKAA